MQSKVDERSFSSASAAEATATVWTASDRSRCSMLSRCMALSSTISTRASGVVGLAGQPGERAQQLLALTGFRSTFAAPISSADMRVVVARNDLHRNVPCGRVVLEPVEHRQARVIRQANIEHDGGRPMLERQLDAFISRGRDHTLELQARRERGNRLARMTRHPRQ